MSRHFRPRLWSTLAAAAGIAATIALGQWQTNRAAQKIAALQSEQEAVKQTPIHIGGQAVEVAGVENRLVEAHGRFDPGGLVLLDNRVRHGEAGYEVVMPLKLDAGPMHVLVNRGWTRGSPDRRRLPDIRTPDALVDIVGLAVVPGRKIFELGSSGPEGPVWQNLTIERYRSRKPYTVQPVMIQQSSDVADGLLREWPTVDRGIDMNRGYALQWFSMSALIALAYLYFSFPRVPPIDR